MGKRGETRSGSELLVLVAGAKGAVGSTVAAAVAAQNENPDAVLSSLTTERLLGAALPFGATRYAGWDSSPRPLLEAVRSHGVLGEEIWGPLSEALRGMEILEPPAPCLGLSGQVNRLVRDMEGFRKRHPRARAVLVNLLPACAPCNLRGAESLEALEAAVDCASFPDLAYAMAALQCGVPVVNFTPNEVESPPVVREAERRGVPMAGRDGKTGQTYLKVVIASALKARRLRVNGWYSVNILGNEDGRNLEDPARAAGKIANKTEVLDELLGYQVGERYGAPAHRVHIGYYPPRGDAKEAWDVVDFEGLFGLPMSLRLNLMARDSILAAPLVLDLARWMSIIQAAGRSGLIPELAFYFKKPLGESPPLTFDAQWAALEAMARELREKDLPPEERGGAPLDRRQEK